jgi:hypothetical protein
MSVKYSKLERGLRHRDFILCVAIISTLILAPNTYWVYHSMMKNFVPIWREIVSAVIAVVTVAGILIYTIRGNIRVANYYMWFEISMSAFYYIITIGWDWWLIPAFSFVFMLPISLKHYTTELNKDKEEKEQQQDWTEDRSMEQSLIMENEDLRRQLTAYAKSNEDFKRYALEIENKFNDLHKEYDTYKEEIGKALKVEKTEVKLSDVSEDELLKMADNQQVTPKKDNPITPLNPGMF